MSEKNRCWGGRGPKWEHNMELVERPGVGTTDGKAVQKGPSYKRKAVDGPE